MNLSKKLLSIFLFTITFAVFANWFLIDHFVIEKTHRLNTKKELLHIDYMMRQELERIGKNLRQQAYFVGSNEMVLSRLNLINNYEDKQNYQPALFDEVKEKLGRYLAATNHTAIDHGAVYDKYGYKVAFFDSETSGYVTYEQGEPRLQSTFSEPERFLPLQIERSKSRAFKEVREGELFVVYHANIIDNRSDQEQFVGTLKLYQKVGNELITLMAEHGNFAANIYIDGKFYVGLLPKLDLATMLPWEEQPGERRIYENDKYVVEEKNEQLAGHKVTYRYIIDRKHQMQLLQEAKTFSLASSLLIVVIILPAAFWFLKHEVMRRLEYLMQKVKNVTSGSFEFSRKKSKIGQNDDEMTRLDKTINLMSLEIVRRQKKLETVAFYDDLTNFYNRNKLIQDAKQEDCYGVCILNIDDFKEKNELYGYDIGDKILKHFAKLIKHYFPLTEYTYYRTYADEFAVIVNNDEEEKYFEKRVREFTRYVEEQPLQVPTLADIFIHITAGIAMDGGNRVSQASIALKRAKRERLNYLVYTQDLQIEKEYENNIYWAAMIESAIKEDRIEVFFQPIYDNREQRVNKYESLIRMIDKEGEVISPFKFLDIAKKTKQYLKLTRIVVDKSFAAFSQNPEIEFSINLTVEDVVSRETSAHILQKLQNYPNPERVILELVESEEIDAFHRAKIDAFIDEIKKFGAKIAIDDFGSGYSNFSYLISIRTNYLKIDGSLIKDIDNDPHKRSVVETIVAFAKKNGIQCIAEFVSSESVQKQIELLSIEYSQGFYHGKPSKNIRF